MTMKYKPWASLTWGRSRLGRAARALWTWEQPLATRWASMTSQPLQACLIDRSAAVQCKHLHSMS